MKIPTVSAWRKAAFGAVLFVVAACVPTAEHPVTRPGQSPDKALLGAWHGKLEGGGAIDLYFLGRQEKPEMTAMMITTGDGAKDHGEWSAFTVVTGEVKGTHYLSALWDYNDGEAVQGRDRGWHIMRYTITPEGTLQLFAVNEDRLLKAVKHKKVEGKIDDKDKKYPEVRVTASSEAFEDYLATIDPLKLFDKPFAAALRRPTP